MRTLIDESEYIGISHDRRNRLQAVSITSSLENSALVTLEIQRDCDVQEIYLAVAKILAELHNWNKIRREVNT